MRTTSERPPKPEYDPDQFVDRTEELGIVLTKARLIANGELEKRRVVVCRGPRGAGKTWLLKELERRALGVSIYPCYRLLQRDLDVQEMRRAMAAQPRPLLLLLDVDGAGGEALDGLADRVLGRLVNDTRVLVVLAERGKGHYWAIPEIRESSEDLDLEPFDEPDITTQLARQVPNTTADPRLVKELGGGFPWANYILAAGLEGGGDPLEVCIDAFLEDINGKLRQQFTALSVLRAFNVDRIASLLCAYSPEFRAREWSYKACRDLVMQLVDSTLARYDASCRGYVIDQSLRSVLVAWLFESNRELWADLHEAAFTMYEGRLRDYPPATQWVEERDYHARCLAQVGRTLPAPGQSVSQEEGEENDR